MQNKSEYEKVVYNNTFRTLLSEDEIKNRIKSLGQQITNDYRGTIPIVIGVLNGSFIFIADLVRAIKLDLEIDFIKLSSYGDAKVSSGRVHVLKEIDADLKDRHVLIAEDIIDTGLSIRYLHKKLEAFQPASLKYVTLLYKKDNAKIDAAIDYVGFEIPNDFVVGYGLDYKQILRNLPAVYVMD